MQFEGAFLREQGVTFAIVIVKRHVLDNSRDADEAIASFRPAFPGVPIVLMGQDTTGRPTYYGRPDIARFLSRLPMRAIPWKRYTLN
jgi:hypothetical protein